MSQKKSGRLLSGESRKRRRFTEEFKAEAVQMWLACHPAPIEFEVRRLTPPGSPSMSDKSVGVI